MDYHPTLQEIRKRCRIAMNGDASAGMRKYGLVYKLNFGLMISQIKEIANRYNPDSELALLLWTQDTRELKIMATMLFPLHDFTHELATKWALEIPNQEIREQISINLLQQLPCAEKLSLEWAGSENPSLRATAYWLLGRLLLTNKLNSFDKLNALPYIWEDVLGKDAVLRNSALLAFKQIGRRNRNVAENILAEISSLKTDNEALRYEVYDTLSFEFEYFAK
jgi:3-methyladenine DNA glycosylase AlkD